MDQRGAVTDQLADVIRLAQLMRKTGVLIVERDGNNGTIEDGKITFIDGHVREATAGRMSGQTAYNWLMTWSTCRFAFTPSSPSPSPMTLLPSATDGVAPNTGRLPSQASVDIAPIRLREANEVLPHFGSLGLTRGHRQLFLLIDGQRSIPDLIRLSARGSAEVFKLLADLDRAGLIKQ